VESQVPITKLLWIYLTSNLHNILDFGSIMFFVHCPIRNSNLRDLLTKTREYKKILLSISKSSSAHIWGLVVFINSLYVIWGLIISLNNFLATTLAWDMVSLSHTPNRDGVQRVQLPRYILKHVATARGGFHYLIYYNNLLFGDAIIYMVL
jgi:hypothetical protein